MDNQKIYDCIIIGGGISGLSFAHYLARENHDILVLEKEKTIGGQIITRKTDNADFWCELGAHTCYNSYKHLLGIVKDLGLESHIRETNKLSYVIYARDKIKSVSSQIFMLSMALHFPRILFAKKAGKTVKEYFEPIVGKSNYTPLFSNLFRAVISQNADNYPANIFLKKRAVRLKDFPRKYTFQDGLQSFIDMMAKKDKIAVRFENEVELITLVDGIFIIDTGANKYYARNVAIATDAKTASHLTKKIHSEISSRLSEIALSKSETLSIVTRREKLSLKKVAGIIPVTNDFTSVVSRDTIDSDIYRGMTFHFGEGDKTMNEKINLICKVLGIDKKDIITQLYTNHILPSLRIKDIGLNEQVNADSRNNIYLLGNYYFGLSIEDCVHRSYVEYERYKNRSLQTAVS